MNVYRAPAYFINQADSDEEDDKEHVQDLHCEAPAPPTRPPLVHTENDTHISMRGQLFRKISLPRIIAEDGSTPTTSTSTAFLRLCLLQTLPYRSDRYRRSRGWRY